jgi:hypothetical protein
MAAELGRENRRGMLEAVEGVLPGSFVGTVIEGESGLRKELIRCDI